MRRGTGRFGRARVRSALAASGLAVALLLPLAPGAAGAERIRSFDVTIELDGSDGFLVDEEIVYDFEGERRRGIFRDIPVRYGRGRSPDYRIVLDVERVTDERGQDRPFRVEGSGADRRIRVGRADVFLEGVQTYRIRYRVRRAVLWFDDHDQIYWNATGTAWPVPIDRARATVVLPVAVSGGIRVGCFTGPQGAVQSDCRADAGSEVAGFESARPLGPGEGLSIVVGLPKGVLEEPSALARWLDRLSDWISLFTLLPFLTFGAMFQLWRTRGRDRGARESIPVRYEPPDGLTPAEVGTVVDERADLADITSSILDLAIRGYLRIEEQEIQKFLFLESTDYRLHKLREPEGLAAHERKLMQSLFADGPVVAVSDLKDNFYKHLPGIREALYTEVSKGKHLFPTSPDSVRTGWAMGGFAVLVLAFFSFMVLRLDQALAVGACGLIVLAFSRVMPRKTRRGRQAYEEIQGFSEFLTRVDRDRLERMGGRSRDTFERILPYAVVLGAADPWAEAFADLYTEPPDWYQSPRHRGSFAPRVFVSDVGHSLSTMGQSLASQPRSSGSGSSGFSSGGGFSGGGFGGGGGGSW